MCPDCGGALGKSASKCRCGWGAKSVPMPRLNVDCAHETCRTPAIVKVKTETGWANFCEYHYKEFHSEEARKRNEARGLFTTEQKIQFCRNLAGKLVKPIPSMREPGQDDEELAA